MAEANLDLPITAARGVATATDSGSVWAPVWKFCRRNPLATFGAVFMAIVLAAAVFAPWISPWDPLRQDLANVLHPPGGAHLLGTDDLGRDVLSRLIYGARISLQAGIITVAFALLFGVAIGLIGGFIGGYVDDVLFRVMDAILAFPSLVLALAISAVLGQGLGNAMVAIAVVFTPQFARLTRGQVLSVKEFEFVSAARAAGASSARLALLHVLPNITSPIVVQSVLSTAAAIIIEASLSFLGVGVRPPTPSWGGMLRAGYGYIEMAPWLSVAPGLAIFATVLAVNFLGDGIQDVLDPRRRSTGR
jgi:ABC-type dipeptide/oligopeptide/nickel transport system permease subunit